MYMILVMDMLNSMFGMAFFKRLEEAFIKQFGQRPKTTYENAYVVMKEIDLWYMDHYSKGWVQFEFD